jgi:hypothetical protein
MNLEMMVPTKHYEKYCYFFKNSASSELAQFFVLLK